MPSMEGFANDFLAPERPPRDSSGRPLLIPAGRPVVDESRIAYTRASGLGDILEEFSYLWKWKMRGLAKGLADSMDLIRLVAAENYTCGFADDLQANRAAGRNIDKVIERAMDRAGVAAKADYGTAIHLRTEPGNDAAGTDPDEKQRVDQASCWDLWRELGVVHLGTEIFTANDTLRSAGTFDHLSYVPGYGIVVTDKKTSSKAKATYDIQLASYANSDIYDVDTDERTTIEDYVVSQGWERGDFNPDVGIIWWIKNGRTEPRILDLVNGYKWAKVSADIRDQRRTMGVAKNVTRTIAESVGIQRANLLTTIGECSDRSMLENLWARPELRAIWTSEHTAAAVAKKESL